LTSVDFYFNASDRLQVACRLAAKAMAQGKRTLVYAPDAELAQRIDRLMWTWPATGFLPHCSPADALAAETPVLIAEEPGPECDILINLSAECPPMFERYARVLEIVDADEEEKRLGRARYGWYRDRGYPLKAHDLAAMGSAA
jgi:DNA polymerase III subunit chi